MSSPNRPARLNRVLLTLTGLVLLTWGAFVLATGFGVLHLLPQDAVLIRPGLRWPTWAGYAAAAVAIVVGLLVLRWLAAQALRRPKTRTWCLTDEPERGITQLHADTAVDPLITDIETYPGVRSAAAWLSGHPSDPALHLMIRTAHDTDLDALRTRIASHALPRLAHALELNELATTVRFDPTGATTRAR